MAITKEKAFKKKRMFKVTRELNVSQDRIEQFLQEHGYAEALSGKGLNASITSEEAYLRLREEYADDAEAAARVRELRSQSTEAEEETARDEVTAIEREEAPEPQPTEAPAAEEETPAEPQPSPAEARVAAEEEEEAPAPEAEQEVITARATARGAQPAAEAEAAPTAEAEEEVPTAEAEAEAPAAEAPEAAETPAAETEPAPEEAIAETAEEALAEAAEAEEEDEAVAAEADDEDFAEDEEDYADEAEEDEPESTLKANRHKLKGTTVLGKVDLSQFKKPRRKRKRTGGSSGGDEDSTTTSTPSRKDRSSKKSKKGRRKRKGQPEEQDVEERLQETLRDLEQGASRVRQRRRQRRRQRHAAEREAELEREAERANILRVTEFISTGELANLMEEPVSDVISTLFDAGMMVSINQRLDADAIQFVADEYGYEIEFASEFIGGEIDIREDDPEDLKPRAPVVTVMGHVDHGKTSLLDYIRHENVVAGEAGGITQHVGAHYVELPDEGGAITFLDTPGHEAFTAMRARGARATDIVILVVAADDAVMPQTIEAINHAQAAEVPLVVAVNKMDLPDADEQKVMAQLAEQNVIVEQYGGSVQCALVSAETGDGVDDLLEKVLLEAELRELKANPDREANGVIIESRLEKGRGNVVTVLVQNGTLHVGDPFVAGIFSGRVRAMFDERDNRIDEVGPSKPALVLGSGGSPEVGDQFVAMDDEGVARDIAQVRQQIHREQALRQKKHITLDEIGRRLALGEFHELNLVIKGDVGGSVEALSDALLKLSTEEVAVNIIHRGVGAITESDVMLASASDAVIIGFQVRPTVGARSLAEQEEIDVRTYSIIYAAIEDVHDALEGMLSPEEQEETIGTAEVRDLFKVPKVGTVAGCYVTDGTISRNDRIRVIREGVVIYEGRIGSLKRLKDDVREVQSGYECGLSVENFNDVKVGDELETYRIIEIARTLEV